ncbi:C4-dicarboxylate TRAP transporter substrate-binding protein [Futiania mangrovi]|uniref:C4-dicarboxylate TRAP transporter substrate-binding protein n=1 Tax=Futiania mangrovi TaxID=2959716 RepID=A0A9J6PE19_9PROT|nr:C4-dicarboxylate TRAP transporter substrate-binding protein [Futiania mangrovii]MCP1336646.1 C4-dicarboxylate TRAP transporter substrate-binding protein [Futiania mangrovii]
MKTKVLALAAAVAAAAAFALPAGAQTVEGPKVSWKLSTWGNPRAFTKGIEHIAEVVKERTGGNFTIEIFYGEALSKARENLDGIKLGAFDAAQLCNFYHPGKNPAWMIFTMPFLPIGDWDVREKVTRAMYKHPAFIADMDGWNAMPYMSALLPQYEFLGRGEPPLKLSDWNGKRVRAGGGLGLAMEVLGATRTTVPATEVYTSMERGTVDAASFPYTYAHAAYKIPEVADWFTNNMSPGTSECGTVFSKTSYGKLPEQYKALLEDVLDEAYDVQVQAYIDIDKKNLPDFKAKLQEILYTPEQLAEFQKVAGTPVWDQWVAENQEKFDARGLLNDLLAEIEKAQKGS